jgi:enoyl-CoA hydratase
MTENFERVRYELPSEGVARIVLARPEAANAQDYLMLSELNDAFNLAAADEGVRVIILAADGKHFSSGHEHNVILMHLVLRDTWQEKRRCI